MRFEVVKGETEHISLHGVRRRNPTVLIRVGGMSLSKKAFLLGLALCACQLLDGLLTFWGLSFLGTEMEGNIFLRELMFAYGIAPALFIVKSVAIVVVVILTLQAHRRRWIRPLLTGVICVYVALAVIPWVFIISGQVARLL